jgi:hypothetical protein
VANGDAPGDGATGNAAGGSSDEAAWQDLVARFDAPAPEAGDGTAPWPEREDLAGPEPSPPEPGSESGPEPDSGPLPAAPEPASAPGSPGPGSGPRDSHAPEDPDDEHYVPPEPPPLPKLNPATKLAWFALFGGPAYLLICTVVGWHVSGLAAFLCVAAFIGGFAALVIRMDNGGPRDSGPGDGAVV